MLYVVLVDGLTDADAALEWLQLDEAHSAKLSGAKHLSVIVYCEPGGNVAQQAQAQQLDCAACSCVEETCIEAGRALGALGDRLSDVAVFLVTFDEGQPVASLDSHWTGYLQARILRLPGSSECFCGTPPPSLTALLDSMPPAAFHVPADHFGRPARHTLAAASRDPPRQRRGRDRLIVTYCNRCGRALWNDADRQEHSKALPCTACGRQFCTRKALSVHIESQHPRCTEEHCGCGEIFVDAAALRRHVSDLHKPIACGVCQKKFTSIKSATRHAVSAHPPLGTPLPIQVTAAGNRAVRHVCCKKCGALGQGHVCPIPDSEVTVHDLSTPSPLRSLMSGRVGGAGPTPLRQAPPPRLSGLAAAVPRHVPVEVVVGSQQGSARSSMASVNGGKASPSSRSASSASSSYSE